MPLEPGGTPTHHHVELDVVLSAFMQLWEGGVLNRLRSMNGMFATAIGREVLAIHNPANAPAYL
jgi:hypothetical protein